MPVSLMDRVHKIRMALVLVSKILLLGDTTGRSQSFVLHHLLKCFLLTVNSRSNTSIRYVQMRDALLDQNRTILFSLCDWGNADVNDWGNSTGNSWRTTGDISGKTRSPCNYQIKC